MRMPWVNGFLTRGASRAPSIDDHIARDTTSTATVAQNSSVILQLHDSVETIPNEQEHANCNATADMDSDQEDQEGQENQENQENQESEVIHNSVGVPCLEEDTNCPGSPSRRRRRLATAHKDLRSATNSPFLPPSLHSLALPTGLAPHHGVKLIAIAGRMNAGKNALATFLEEELVRRDPSLRGKCHRRTFAAPVRDLIRELFHFDDEFINAWKRDPRPPVGMQRNMRELLQHVGDLRSFVPNVWIHAFCASLPENGCVIVTDVRHQNELKMLTRMGATILMVTRSCCNRHTYDATPVHSSERDLDKYRNRLLAMHAARRPDSTPSAEWMMRANVCIPTASEWIHEHVPESIDATVPRFHALVINEGCNNESQGLAKLRRSVVKLIDARLF